MFGVLKCQNATIHQTHDIFLNGMEVQKNQEIKKPLVKHDRNQTLSVVEYINKSSP